MKPQTNRASARAGYTDPVRKLLSLGVDRRPPDSSWPQYGRLYGIGPQHVDALVRMARDPKLTQGTRKESWAPVHAWRALGQIGAQEAIGPLVELVRIADDEDDLLHEELPKVFGMIGPASMPRLTLLLEELDGGGRVRTTALDALRELGERHPGSRDQVVGILVEALGPDASYDPTDRGFVVSALIDLHAVEALGAIRSAYQRGTVDKTFAGDLEDVELDLGVREQRSTPKPNYAAEMSLNRPGAAPNSAPPASKKIGRNDPCPCGSGKKYKKCCGG